MLNYSPTPRAAFIAALVFFTNAVSVASPWNSVTLAWDANTEPDLEKYWLHYGSASGVYTTSIDVGNTTTAVVSDLPSGAHYFAVTAENTANLESAPSDEVVFTARPDSFSAWQGANAELLGTEVAPSDNPDGDAFDNALEYALALDPTSGIEGESLGAALDEGSGLIEVSFLRRAGGLVDVTYTLQAATALTDPTVWVPWSGPAPAIVDNGDGTERVIYEDLESNVGASGVVRLQVDLAGAEPGSHWTPAFGWDTADLLAGMQTCCYPYATASVFSGELAAGAYDLFGGSLPAVDSDAVLAAGREYLVEFTAGPFAGHRFDVLEAGTTATDLALDVGSARNTLAPVPPLLSGSYAVRPHLTLAELVDPQLAVPTNDSTLGDRALFFNGGDWESYWVTDLSGTIAPRWVDVGDPQLQNAGGRIIDACEGFFLSPQGGTIALTRVGVVREWPFACPLNVGQNLVGGAYPLDQSPADRAMERADGDGSMDWFTGSNDPLQADQLMFWLGDGFVGAEGYTTFFRLFLGAVGSYDYWTDQTNSDLLDVDDTPLFPFGRAAFYRMQVGHDRSDPQQVWLWPAPWAADAP